MRSAPPRILAFSALSGLWLACGGDEAAPPPAGPTWSRYTANPVLSPGSPGSWDARGVGSPFVLQVDAITYAMWYTGRDSSGARIGLATSTDGVDWTKHPANPILGPGAAGSWDGVEVRDPCVLYDGSSYVMYYTGSDGTAKRIGVATSPDGVVWSRTATGPVLEPGAAGSSWDDREVRTPWVLREGATLRMWYGGRGAQTTAIGYATSNDGLLWTRSLSPVLHPEVLEAVPTAPCVVRSGSGFRMWYAAYHENSGGGGDPGVIDLAQSPDGLGWTFAEMALAPGDAGAWDARTLRSACVLPDGGAARMWYAAEDSAGTGAIGLAFLP